MNHTKCQGFEARINAIMDLRRDPSQDQELRNHALICADCNEMLESFSELHTGLSGPNKIPIALLASESRRFGKSEDVLRIVPSAFALRWIASAGSLAALLLIGLTIVIASLNSNPPSSLALINRSEAPRPISIASLGLKQEKLTVDSGKTPAVFPHIPNVTIRQISDGLRSLPVYHYSGDLPGFRPFQSSLDLCIDWFQNSLFNFSGNHRSPSPEPPASNTNSGFGFQPMPLWDARLA